MKKQQDEYKNDNTDQEDVSFSEIFGLLMEYIVLKMNMQKILFLLSFLTFGVADGLSAVYMIENKGVMGEANPFIRIIYASSGASGVISIKIWLVLIILSLVWKISREGNNYWMINGFLFSLFIGGILATGANLLAARGLEYPDSGTIVATYLFLMILLTLVGDAIDRIYQ